ncbi:helix-turn-helix domain-containing protein [Paenibacillus sp. 1001270B_150601_E10]|uniref:helix-turn-helix domain-containing protein n=1 Tax=Paenibacillus sp. 1001270B_150601_E10 TaxID=2787079 RepID=UPI0018A0C6AC|nr:AraC family transcriptional regulator [Paenibacillus sp. 1001270B_150601_E10]
MKQPTIFGSVYISRHLESLWANPHYRRLWMRFLFPYLLFLGLTLIAGWIAYHATLSAFERVVLERNAKAIQQAQELLDVRLSEVELIAEQMAEHPKIKAFQVVRNPFDGHNVLKVMSTRMALKDYAPSNQFLKDYFVVFKNSDLAITPHRVQKLKEFYGDRYQVNGWSLSDWRSRMLDRYRSQRYMASMNVTYRDSMEPMITYVRSLGYPGYYQGVVVGLIPNEEVKKLLPVLKDGWIQIVDQEGQPMAFFGKEGEEAPHHLELPAAHESSLMTVNGKEVLITQHVSPKTKWTFITAQPTSEVLKSVLAIKRTTFTLAGVLAVVIIALALWLSRRNSRPIQSLYDHVIPLDSNRRGGKKSKPSDIFSTLREAYTDLVDTTATLHQKLLERQEYARIALFGKWLRGGYLHEQQLEASLGHVGLERNAHLYAVSLLHLGWHGEEWSASILEEMELKRFVVRDEIYKASPLAFDLVDIEQDQLAVIFYGDERSYPEKERFAMTIDELLIQLDYRLKSYPIYVICSVGSIVSNRLAVSRSYLEAKQLMDGVDHEASRTIGRASIYTWWTYEEQDQHGLYIYRDTTEQQLIHAIRGGNSCEAEKLVNEIWKENGADGAITSSMKRWLLADLYATVMKQGISLDIPLLADPHQIQKRLMKQTESPTSLFRMIEAEAVHLSKSIHERKRSRNDVLLQQMKAYIDEHIGDPALSLVAVADHLQVSEAYVSAFFKEQQGVNFSDYIEQMRLTEAKSLMEQDLPLTAIAERVGYNSLNSFSRAFKRVHGMSASDYRKWNNGLKKE